MDGRKPKLTAFLIAYSNQKLPQNLTTQKLMPHARSSSYDLFTALRMTANNIWQIVAAPLLQQKVKEQQILDLEIKTLEDQLAMLKAKLENEKVFESDDVTDKQSDDVTDKESDDVTDEESDYVMSQEL